MDNKYLEKFEERIYRQRRFITLAEKIFEGYFEKGLQNSDDPKDTDFGNTIRKIEARLDKEITSLLMDDFYTLRTLSDIPYVKDIADKLIDDFLQEIDIRSIVCALTDDLIYNKRVELTESKIINENGDLINAT